MLRSRLGEDCERRLKLAGGSKGLVERVIARAEHGLSLYKQDSDSFDADFFEPLKPDLDALIKITEEIAAMTQSRSVVCQERLRKAELAIGNCQASMSAKQQEVNAANGTLANFKHRAAVGRRKVEDLQREIDENNRALAEVKERKENLAKYFWVPGWNLYLAVRRLDDICEEREPILARRLRNELDEKNATEARLRAEHVKHDALAEQKRVMEWTIRDLKDSRTVLEENCKLYSARFVLLSDIIQYYRMLSTKIENIKANLDLPQAIEKLYETRRVVQLNGEVRVVTLKAALIRLNEDYDRYLGRGRDLVGDRVRRRPSLKLLSIQEPLPPNHRLATVKEVTDNRGALYTAMPSWEIANLADGCVWGWSYGGSVSSQIRNDVGHKLAVEVSTNEEPTIEESTSWRRSLVNILLAINACVFKLKLFWGTSGFTDS